MGVSVAALYTSNSSIGLYAQEICVNMVKMAMVNAWLYIPWVALPAHGLIYWTTDADKGRF
jgi:hypothetical protein